MKLALENPVGPVFALTPELMQRGLDASLESPRKRMLFPMHRAQDDLVQRMLNFLQPGTYIHPHLHPRDHAIETLLVMRGELGFVIFDEEGAVVSRHRLASGELIDIEQRVWHGVLALAPDTVILEIKRGPYDESDKIFATWAPGENESGAADYLSSLESLFAS